MRVGVPSILSLSLFVGGLALSPSAWAGKPRDRVEPAKVAPNDAPAEEPREAKLIKPPRAPRWGPKTLQRCASFLPLIRKVAREERMDLGLVMGIVRLESRFHPKARSYRSAQGLMQVMPSSGRRQGCGDLNDPEANVRCGIRLLKGFLKHYRGNLIYALSGYASGFRIPNEARRRNGLPTNVRYFEKVMAARAWFLRNGCGD